jgi:hypothetical protein
VNFLTVQELLKVRKELLSIVSKNSERQQQLQQQQQDQLSDSLLPDLDSLRREFAFFNHIKSNGYE